MASVNGGAATETGVLDIAPMGDEIMKPGTLHSLEDVIAWIYGHEGVIEERWRHQFSSNKAVKDTTQMCQTFMTSEIKELRRELAGIRKLLYIAMGMVILLGAAIPLIPIFHNHP
jgi:hypothetical protein